MDTSIRKKTLSEILSDLPAVKIINFNEGLEDIKYVINNGHPNNRAGKRKLEKEFKKKRKWLK